MNDDPYAEPSSQFFTEEQTPSVNFSVRVRRRLISKRTAYQQLEIVDTEEFGRVMALDGKIMVTQRDERFYHEMLVHPAVLSHKSPQNVVIIGGGDGGAARQVLQHSLVEHLLWSEIDEEVIRVSRQYLPALSKGVFQDRRVELRIAPGEQLITQLNKIADIVIVDSTDPIGPAVPLFSLSFMKACAGALRPGGIYVTQSGSPFFYPEELRLTYRHLRQVFKYVRPFLGFVPSYPSVWSYCMASDVPLAISLKTITKRFHDRAVRATYFTPELHHASAVLPGFVKKLLSVKE